MNKVFSKKEARHFFLHNSKDSCVCFFDGNQKTVDSYIDADIFFGIAGKTEAPKLSSVNISISSGTEKAFKLLCEKEGIKACFSETGSYWSTNVDFGEISHQQLFEIGMLYQKLLLGYCSI